MQNDYKKLDIYKFFQESKLLSTKGNTFFDVYSELLSKYKNKKITFVEIGVKWGGSLFMWKRFFGKKARIIGIDLDPSAKELEKFGFEIFIGDQSSKKFWDDFFSNVGSIDILLDDGGHTNEHQILTLNYVLDNINNGGIIIVEDVICSYQKKFDNPSKYSFINYSKFLIDDLNGRYVDNIKKGVTTHPPKGVNKQKSLNKSVYSIKFYTNFVVFFIDRKKCIDTDFIFNKKKWKVEDNLIKVQNQNLRWSSHIYSNQILENKVIKRLGKIFFFLKDNFFVNTILRKITVKIRQNKIKSFFE